MITDHRHAGGQTNCVEIDPHVCLQPISHSLAPPGVVLNTPEAEKYGEHAWGYIVGHDREGFDVRCEGAVRTCHEHAEPRLWDETGTLQGGNLTLTPSILCQLGNVGGDVCGFHGYVRNGRWVPA